MMEKTGGLKLHIDDWSLRVEEIEPEEL